MALTRLIPRSGIQPMALATLRSPASDFETHLRRCLPGSNDLGLIILTGHLLLEEEIDGLIFENLANPAALQQAGLSFPQRLCLARALAIPASAPTVAKASGCSWNTRPSTITVSAGLREWACAARMEAALAKVNFAERIGVAIGDGAFSLLGVAFFAVMGGVLYWIAVRETPAE